MFQRGDIIGSWKSGEVMKVLQRIGSPLGDSPESQWKMEESLEHLLVKVKSSPFSFMTISLPCGHLDILSSYYNIDIFI